MPQQIKVSTTFILLHLVFSPSSLLPLVSNCAPETKREAVEKRAKAKGRLLT